MSRILAIDPGSTESAYVVTGHDLRPVEFAKVDNTTLHADLHRLLMSGVDEIAIEMIASYGMAVGAEVFQTCVWIGRFTEVCWRESGLFPDHVLRQPIKVHHCHSAKAKDGNIIQALVDRFASGASNKGKGTKAAPGWFYGFHDDIWQAYALAVYVADTNGGGS